MYQGHVHFGRILKCPSCSSNFEVGVSRYFAFCPDASKVLPVLPLLLVTWQCLKSTSFASYLAMPAEFPSRKCSVTPTKAHYCKRPTLLCSPRSFLLHTKNQTRNNRPRYHTYIQYTNNAVPNDLFSVSLCLFMMPALRYLF